MKKILLASLVVFLIFAAGTVNLSAQGTKNVFKQKVEKSRGENPDIKDADICKITDKEVADPTTARGAYCVVTYKNHTGYFINIWIDRLYYGVIAPHSSSNITVASGWKNFYCETYNKTYFWKDQGACDGFSSF